MGNIYKNKSQSNSNMMRSRILSSIVDMGSSCFFYWDVKNDEWCVEEGNFEGILISSDVKNPLEMLVTSERLGNDSQFVLDRYLRRIMRGTKYPLPASENESSVTFRIKSDDVDEIYTFTTYFDKDENGLIKAITGKGRRYTDQEIMDNEILARFSVDKNPIIYYERVENLINKHTDRDFACIEFDLESYRMICDYHGNETGERLLVFINSMLGVLCGDMTAFARLNSDVFSIVMPYENVEQVKEFIDVLDANLRWYQGLEYKIVYGVSIIDRGQDRAKSMNAIEIKTKLDGAGIARKSIKGNELKNVAFFEENQKHSIEHKKSLTARLRHAIANEEFVLYLQPKFDISTENLIGAEALVRWDHPEAGIITPEQFIGILESNGLILNVDKYIWEQTCYYQKKWLDMGKKARPISVNVSRTYIDTSDIVDYFKKLIDKYDIPSDLIEIEITETAENKDTGKLTKELKNAGFTVLIDDFGTGYSSLNMLKSTEFDILKLDKSFLTGFMDDERGKTILSHTIAMSKAMGIDMVAEGVETKEQAEFLKKCGCMTAQGFYYSEPLSALEFETLL